MITQTKLFNRRSFNNKRIIDHYRNPALIMGILNVTYDSFSGDGILSDDQSQEQILKTALSKAIKMVNDGVDIIDIGAESTRPNSTPIDTQEEIRRVIPVIKEISSKLNTIISVDTYKSKVARLALENGASMINDISAMEHDPDMVGVVKDFNAKVVLMHMQGNPSNMQDNPQYKNVVKEISNYLKSRIEFARKKGIKEDKIIIDPGIGFGKSLEHNLEILRNLNKFKQLNKPLLVGTSRKSFIGRILNKDVKDRLYGSLASVVYAVINGADIVRVHDVKETKESLDLLGRISL